jgi:hypothetical protein
MKYLQRNARICKEKICTCTDCVKEIDQHSNCVDEMSAKKCTDL